MRRAQLVANMVASSATQGESDPAPVTLNIDGAFWNVEAKHHHQGIAGSSLWCALIFVGDDHGVYYLHTADTPTGAAACGPNPFSATLSATEFPECAGKTGHAVTLPAGNSTPAAHAALLAAVLEAIPGVVSATPAIAANDDGGWGIEYVGPPLTFGTRAWASAGVSGSHGGPHYRMTRSGDGPTVTSVDLTATIGSALEAPAANAIACNVSIVLGTTVNTSVRPRLHARRLATPGADPAASTVLMDFDRIPASEIVAGRLATIWLTPTQIDALYTALHTTLGSGQLWLAATSSGGTHYAACSTGNTVSRGQQVQQNLRTAANNDPTAAPPATWTTNGSFAVWLGARLGYRIAPATNGEHRPALGSVTAIGATGNGNVTLPDSYTCSNFAVVGAAGMRIRRVQLGITSGTVRCGIVAGGDVTLPGVSAVGATPLVDLGTNGGATGAVDYLAPTGASTVRVPTSGGIWVVFYGATAQGIGEVGPSPFVVAGINNPASQITIGGANNGNAEREQDVAQAGLGNAAVALQTVPGPDGVVLTAVDNCPHIVLELYSPPFSVAA
jgi:hypothetical protein